MEKHASHSPEKLTRTAVWWSCTSWDPLQECATAVEVTGEGDGPSPHPHPPRTLPPQHPGAHRSHSPYSSLGAAVAGPRASAPRHPRPPSPRHSPWRGSRHHHCYRGPLHCPSPPLLQHWAGALRLSRTGWCQAQQLQAPHGVVVRLAGQGAQRLRRCRCRVDHRCGRQQPAQAPTQTLTWRRPR